MDLIPTETKELFRFAFLGVNGIFWFLSVSCAMYMASEVWRFSHTVVFINEEIARRAATGILVSAALVVYSIGLFGCFVGMRMKRTGMIAYLVLSAVGILIVGTVIIVLFAGSAMSLRMTSVAKIFWDNAGRKTQAFIQEELQCCGYNSPADVEPKGLDESCYKAITYDDKAEYKPFTEGCRLKMENILKTRWNMLRGFCVVIALVQVCGIISGSSIFVRLRRTPLTKEEEITKKRSKNQVQYNPMPASSTTAPTSGGLRQRGGAGSQRDMGRDSSAVRNARPQSGGIQAKLTRPNSAYQGVGLTPVDVDAAPIMTTETTE